MAEPSWPASVELSSYLTDVQTHQLKLRVPVPIVVLTAELIRDVPRRVGLRNASELVAALLVRASEEGHLLADAIEGYRETQAYEVLSTDQIQGSFEIPTRSSLDLT